MTAPAREIFVPCNENSVAPVSFAVRFAVPHVDLMLPRNWFHAPLRTKDIGNRCACSGSTGLFSSYRDASSTPRPFGP
jgi:hypothetical protein